MHSLIKISSECNDGTYGYSCTNICSGHCLNDSPCNKRSGHCDGGCNPGYTNIDCNKGKFSLETYQGLVILCNECRNIKDHSSRRRKYMI